MVEPEDPVFLTPVPCPVHECCLYVAPKIIPVTSVTPLDAPTTLVSYRSENGPPPLVPLYVPLGPTPPDSQTTVPPADVDKTVPINS